MRTLFDAEPRVLAIDPTSRGLGFAVMEGPRRLVDWGTIETREAKSSLAKQKVAQLIAYFHPDVLVLEECADRRCRRRARVRKLIEGIRGLAKRQHLRPAKVPMAVVHRIFGETKHEVATSIAARFPELARRLPPKRKPWQSEDSRMSIFDACGLALAYLHLRAKRQQARSVLPVKASLPAPSPVTTGRLAPEGTRLSSSASLLARHAP